jgi:hypothetical protein
MTIYEILYPGTSIEMDEAEGERRVHDCLDLIETKFTEASIALFLFQRARQNAAFVLEALDRRDSGVSIRAPANAQFCGSSALPTEWNLLCVQMPLEEDRRKWQSGEHPHSYVWQMPFMFARLFLFAVHDIQKGFHGIAESPGAPTSTLDLRKRFDQQFPMLRALRDSSAHIDERFRGEARGQRIVPADRVVWAEYLKGSRLVGTTADGRQAEIEVSEGTMLVVQELLQELVNAFSWSGPPRHYPR